MKKILGSVCMVIVCANASAQNHSAAFEKVIREGNSTKAFEFVRNTFGLPASQDAFLHFKERGIKQLISYCSYGDRRIEATSLIKYNQTKEFWKNYSQQFTAGKWDYRTLYKNDSLAWQAANYSITLIYAHEMGHYMSYRYINPEAASYTCEEVVANECLTAFANLFNGHKKMDQHKKLFIELCRQTAAAIPDSTKTIFSLPLQNWCTPNPMDSFFQYYEKDELRFLRLYGYLQFRMMEQLLTNTNEALTPHLNRKFLHFNMLKTAKKNFKPLPYRIVQNQNIAKTPLMHYIYNRVDEEGGGYYKAYFYNNEVVHLGADGAVLTSIVEKTNVYPKARYDDPAADWEQFTMWNRRLQNDSLHSLQGLTFIDSIKRNNIFAQSAIQAHGSYWYLLRRMIKPYSYRDYMADNINTDSLDKLPVRSLYQFLYLQPKENNIISYREFELPDSLDNYDSIFYRRIHLAGFNNVGALVVNNEYRKNNQQRLTLYAIDTAALSMGVPIWQYESTDSSFFNIETPSVFLDTATRAIQLAFFNPVTERIYLIRIHEIGSESYELFNPLALAMYGQQMKVTALRMIAPRKMYVLAQCRKAGNTTKTEIKKLLIQW